MSNTSATQLHKNPFHVLGATTRDDRQRILALAEERALRGDPDLANNARADLTTPRRRLTAEVGWLPGIAPRRAAQLLKTLSQNPLLLREEEGLSALARANVLASVWESVGEGYDKSTVAGFILESAKALADVDPTAVLRDINEDRSVSGFPQVSDVTQLEGPLNEQKRSHQAVIKAALNRLPTLEMVAAVDEAVSQSTANGTVHAPLLVDELVDSYQLEAQFFLEQESETALTLVQTGRDLAPAGEKGLIPVIARLEQVVGNWRRIAKPIQISAKARGTAHQASQELAESIRDLSVHLYNKHDMLDIARRLNTFLRRTFGELPNFNARLEEDEAHLAKLAKGASEAEQRKAEWKREISLRAEIGLFHPNILSINAEGISWKKAHMPLESVTGLRWGGVTRTYYFVARFSTYTVGVSDGKREIEITLDNKEIYSAFTEKLWRAVSWRLISTLLNTLKGGTGLKWGDAVIYDDHVELPRKKFFGKGELVRYEWSDTQIWDADGKFHIGAKTGKALNSVALSYKDFRNTIILERVIALAFKKPGLQKLSDLLE